MKNGWMALYLLLTVLLVSCGDGVAEFDLGDNETQSAGGQAEEEVIQTDILPNPILDGQQTVASLSLDNPVSSDKTIYYQIVDENGDLADDYFLNDEDSAVILNGDSEVDVHLTSTPSSVPTGEEIFDFKVSDSSTGPFEKVAIIKLTASSESSIEIDTVSISNLENDAHANILNQSNYDIDGVCSAVGGSVEVTISQGSDSISDNVSCDPGEVWGATFDLSSLTQEGSFEVKAIHSGPNVPGNATRQMERDVTLSSVEITSPAQGSYIGTSNEGNFSVSGDCSEETRMVNIEVTSDGGAGSVTGSGECQSSEEWSEVLDVSTLPDGTLTADVAHADLAGNSYNDQRTFTKNTVNPVIEITSPTMADVANSLDYTNQTVEGTCNKNNADVNLSGDVAGTVTGTCDGVNFEITGVEVTGVDGFRGITATITDEYANIETDMSFIQKATALPTAVLNGIPGSVSNQENLNITVGDGDVSEYRYKVGDQTLDCTVGSGYSSEISTNTPITDSLGSDGDKRVCVVGIDSYGNPQGFSSPTQYSWTKDTSAPALTIDSPAANSYVNSLNEDSFEVSGTCGINGINNVTIEGSITTTQTNCDNGQWERVLDFSAVSDGPVFILVSQEDPNTGNVGQEDRLFTKETTLPQIEITSPASNTYINKDNRTSFTIEGTCDEFSSSSNIEITGGVNTVDVACDGSNFSADLEFPDNEDNETPTVEVEITDTAGNPETDSRDFILDTVSPSVAFTSPSAGSYANIDNVSSFDLTGTCSDVELNSIVIEEGSTTLATVDCTGGSPNSWSGTVDLSGLDEGANTLSVTHTDEAGNDESADLNITKDTQAPTVAWATPSEEACSSPGSLGAFEISGQCVDGDGDVSINSAQLSSTATASCSGGSFSTPLNLNDSGLSDGDTYTVNISQEDSAGNAQDEDRNFKYITSQPTIELGGWEDVYAIGKKTYADGNADEDGVVRFEWKDWASGNVCTPNAVKVFRSATAGNSLSGTEVSSGAFPDGIPSDQQSFEDTTLNDTDFSKAWYYGLKVVVGEWEVDVTGPSSLAELRVMAPPENMALVHRWITNQEVCGLIESTPDPDNHYRCTYTGQGNDGGYVDMGNDLLVDRFELGCNVSANCGASGSETCVSSNFNDTSHAYSGVGVEAPIGAVFYNDVGNTGYCYYKYGAGDTEWDQANGITMGSGDDQLGLMTTSRAHAPPFVRAHRDRMDIACGEQEVDLSAVDPYADNSANGMAPKRLMTQKEWRATAAWDREMDFPSAYSDVDDWIHYVESGNSRSGDPDGDEKKCNTSNRNGNLSTTDRDFLWGFELHGNTYETGSKIATNRCQSRYGVQDMIGNVWERVSDELNCSDDLGDSCSGVVSSLDGNTDMDGFDFDGTQGPGGQVPTDPIYTSETWYLHSGDNGTTHFNPVLGLPLMSNENGSVAIADWVAEDLFHNDYFWLNSTNGNAVRGLLLGGSWYAGSQNGRWASSWSLTPSHASYYRGGRCALPVE